MSALVKYLFCLIAVFFCCKAIDLACGPEPDPYDYYISFFRNNIQKDDSYKPFYFNGCMFLNEDDEPLNESYVNSKEWAAYLRNGIQAADVGYIFYGLDDKTDSIYFRPYAGNLKILPDSLKKSPFLKLLARNKSALTYFKLSKQTEPYVSLDRIRWTVSPASDVYKKFADTYLEHAYKEKSKFLRLRHFYQAQRMLYYGGLDKEASAVYNKSIKDLPSASHVKGWALSLEAGSLASLGQKAEAARLFTLVFAKYPERRIQAYNGYHFLKVPEADVIAKAKNGHERAYIYAMKGFHTRPIGLTPLAKVYDTDPHSELFSLLLVREINKIEEEYLTQRMNGSGFYGSIGYWGYDKYDSVKNSHETYIPQLRAFCDRVAKEGKYPEPALCRLASAYLSWMRGDTREGMESLDIIDRSHIGSKLNDEEQLIRLLLLSQSIKKLDDSTERKLLPSLNWLDGKVKHELAQQKPRDEEEWGSYYRFKNFAPASRDFYEKVLAPIYLKQKDTAKAALCILRGEQTIKPTAIWDVGRPWGFNMPEFWRNYLRPIHLKTIVNWQQQPGKTPYMTLLMSEIDGRLMNGIYHVWGTACLREHQYSTAAKIYRRMQPFKAPVSKKDRAYWNYYIDRYDFPRADLFADDLTDAWHYLPKNAKGYTPLSFAEAMAGLQNRIKSDPKNAAYYYFKMATALYNTSFYGPGWYLSSYKWETGDEGRPPLYYYDRDYMQTRTAEAWYLKARSLSSDAEFKARCTFMVAKCHRNRIIHPSYPEFWKTGEKEFEKQYAAYEAKVSEYEMKRQRLDYFTELRQHYGNTKFYKAAINECTFLRDFLASADDRKPRSKGK